MMAVRLGSLAASWLAASLTAGLGAAAAGLRPSVRLGETPLATLDIALGWLLTTLPATALALLLFFVPVAVLLEWRGARSPSAYGAGGAFGGLAAMTLFVAPAAWPQWAALLPLPGIAAGTAWWLLAARPARLDSSRAKTRWG